MRYSPEFDIAFERVIGHEGGFQADPRDRGNWTGGAFGQGDLNGTKFGISAMSYPDLDIRGLTPDQAKAIYWKEWWLPLKMERMPQALPYQLFDAAINHGKHRASMLLQHAVRTTTDGAIGPKTLAAAAAMDHNDILMRFLAARLRFMAQIKTWPTYGKGWAVRIADNLDLAAEDN